MVKMLTLAFMLALAVAVAFGLTFDLRLAIGGRSVAAFGYVSSGGKVWVGTGYQREGVIIRTQTE